MIRPITFSGDMVRAILDGRKTETRRPVKPKKHMMWEKGKPWWSVVACPYGRPGDILWVREMWAIPDSNPLRGRVFPREYVAYAASCPLVDIESPSIRWRPSVHMPRWACRLVLEITDVRMERLRDITEEGARAEGFESRAAFLFAYRAMYKLVPDANPYVWVIGFKVADVGNEAAQAMMRDAA